MLCLDNYEGCGGLMRDAAAAAPPDPPAAAADPASLLLLLRLLLLLYQPSTPHISPQSPPSTLYTPVSPEQQRGPQDGCPNNAEPPGRRCVLSKTCRGPQSPTHLSLKPRPMSPSLCPSPIPSVGPGPLRALLGLPMGPFVGHGAVWCSPGRREMQTPSRRNGAAPPDSHTVWCLAPRAPWDQYAKEWMRTHRPPRSPASLRVQQSAVRLQMAVWLSARCVSCVVHLRQRAVSCTCGRGPSPSLPPGGYRPRLPWGRPAALLDGATEVLAGPCPRCLRALVGHCRGWHLGS